MSKMFKELVIKEGSGSKSVFPLRKHSSKFLGKMEILDIFYENMGAHTSPGGLQNFCKLVGLLNRSFLF